MVIVVVVVVVVVVFLVEAVGVLIEEGGLSWVIAGTSGTTLVTSSDRISLQNGMPARQVDLQIK